MGVWVQVKHCSGFAEKTDITPIGQSIHHGREALDTALGLAGRLIFASQDGSLVCIVSASKEIVAIACQHYVGPRRSTNPKIRSEPIGDGFCYLFTPDIGGHPNDFPIFLSTVSAMACANPDLCSSKVRADLGLVPIWSGVSFTPGL